MTDTAGTAKPKRIKPKSRATRWAEAASLALRGLEDLVELQSEYQEWYDNLPENLQTNGPVAEKLETIINLDLESAKSTVEDADGAELPLGFGRD